jgi:hypothetical protein
VRSVWIAGKPAFVGRRDRSGGSDLAKSGRLRVGLGSDRREALRCLKRHLARHVHRLLSMPPTTPEPMTRIQLNSAISVPCLT